MIVTNIINHAGRYPDSCSEGKAEFASLHKGNFSISDKMLKTSSTSDTIALKDVKYCLEGGVLYIQGTQIFHENISRFAERYDIFSSRDIYLIGKRQLELLESPPEIKEVVIKRWWRNNLKFKAYEAPQDASNWFKLKEELPFEAALSNFRFREDGNDW